MYSDYVNVVKDNLDKLPNEWTFKGNSNYTTILENASKELGNQYIEVIGEEILNYIKYIYNNDKYGNPIKNYFKFLNIIIECSPSNFRYIYHAMLILKYLISINKKEVDIIEIGGGYGGLCYYLMKLSKYYNIIIKSYHIFDLKDVSKLQKLYIDNIIPDNNITTSSLDDDYSYLKEKSFLISNYAFSELSEEYRKIYEEKVISKYISNGFMVWNNCKIYKFINKELREFRIEIEHPNSNYSNAMTNCFVYF